jgi:hypothetical protein
VVLGSSRVLNFRAGFLNEQPSTFYNAGGAGWTLNDMQSFLDHLDTASAPKVLLLGLDQPTFNPAGRFAPQPVDIPADEFTLEGVVTSTRSMIQGILLSYDRLGSLGNLASRREPTYHDFGLGVLALIRGDGYRNDGSRQLGRLIVDPSPIAPKRRADLQAFTSIYPPGDTLSQPALDTVDAMLKSAKAKGITVVGFAPPFMPSLYQALVSSGQYGYLPETQARLKALFARYGYPYLDFSDGGALGASDEEFIDSWHPSELACLRVFLKLRETLPDILAPYADPDGLGHLIDSNRSPLVVFER